MPRVAPLEGRLLLATLELGGETLVNATVAGVQRLADGGDRAVAVDGSGTIVTAWSDAGRGGTRIRAQRTAADGTPLGGEVEVAGPRGGAKGRAVVAASEGGRFVVAWVGLGNPGDPAGLGVFARVYAPDGTPASDAFRVNATVPGNQQDPAIAWVSADRFVVAWDGAGAGRGQTVLARLFDAGGRPASDEVRVPDAAAGGQSDPAVVSLPSGGFQVAWAGAGSGDATGVFSRQFDASARPIGPEFRANTARGAIEQRPALARDGDRQVVIAWQAVGNPMDRSGTGSIARRFGVDGAPRGGEFLLNETRRGPQSDPAIAFLADGRLAAAWQGAGPGDGDGIHLREFFGNGAPRGPEQVVNATTRGRQASPSVQAQPTGGYVVAWAGRVDGVAGGATADASGVALQRFGDALIAMPGNTPGFTSPSDVLWYDASATDPRFMKTITITNQSLTETIYPFLEDANSRTALPGDPSPAPTYRGTGMFDPFDPIDHEYRGYIGFRQDGRDYLGLAPGQTITVNVPLAFWDALRVNFTTDGDVSAGGSDLLGPNPAAPAADQLAQPNPFLFRYENTQQKNVGSTTPNSPVLTFTPIYDSFRDGLPYVDPTLPTRPPTIVAGMTVTGPGLPSGGVAIIDVGPDSVTLASDAGTAEGGTVNQTDAVYTFQAPAGTTLSPTARYAVDAVSGPDYPGSITNGRILWYHATLSETPLNDAPFQLSEVTFRGDYYDPAANPGSGFRALIGDAAFAGNNFDLINYDLSYVDSMTLPLAIEADGVPIPNTSASAPFGWAGSSQAVEDMEAAIRAFASDNAPGEDTNFLGDYFGGRGYPSYFNPAADVARKLPSGQNIFIQSPFLGTPSSYPVVESFPDGTFINLPLYALTSGGVGPYQIVVGGDSAFPQLEPNQIRLNNTTDADRALLRLLLDGLAAKDTYEVTSSLQPGSDVPSGTTLSRVLTDDDGVPTGVVELSNPTVASNRGLHTYTFTRPVSDYAATAIMGLWYSWAQFYADSVATALGVSAPINLTGRTGGGAQANQLLLDPGQPGAASLVPGMAVGLGGASFGVILAVDGQTVTLSRALAGAGTFTFSPPALGTLAGAGDSTWSPLVDFDPGDEGLPVEFARTVYVTMAAMSATVAPGSPYPSVQLLANIIGATVSFLPALNADVQTIVTDQIKSLLRGVPDFTDPRYANQSQWYPDPALPTGGQGFNVYNLDPFVWFVHEKLGLSGYGFSVDDDTSDVGANLTSRLKIGVGGLSGTGPGAVALPNPNEWSTIAPYGPVSGGGTVAADPSDGRLTRVTGLPATVPNQIFGYNQPLNLTGALVNGPGVRMGTTVVSLDPTGAVTLSDPIDLAVGSTGTFAFFAPVVARGTIGSPGQPGNTIVLQDRAAFDTLQLIGPLANVQVTGPNIDPGQVVTVLGADPATLTITLSRPLGTGSRPGSYAYTFGHARPYAPS